MDITDTICALSTPPGRSGIAFVRLSGADCPAVLRQITGKAPPEPRKACLRRLRDPRSGEEIDEAVVTFFKAPHSYTGENLAEISPHGNPSIIAALLDVLCHLGARLALPGEFTMRAFLRGRIDLAGAEAVRDIIEARTLYQARVAGRQRGGALAKELQPVKDRLIEAIVNLESAVEFAEEDLTTASREAIFDLLGGAAQRAEKLINSFRKGRFVREGFTLAIVGPPNAGKSSVFNALLGRDRSIVTDIPGTTRDLVSEDAAIGGIPVRLEDTAGLRADGGEIEKLGMERSRRAAADADAVLLVVDASRNLSEEEYGLRRQLTSPAGIVIFNKSDLPARVTEEEKQALSGSWPHVHTSAKTGHGIDEARNVILKQISGGEEPDRDDFLITNLRHCQALEKALTGMERGAGALKNGMSEEFALFDLRKALDALGEITGETNTENLLDEIFSRFCIGK
ncbi:MAG: tRNA uridine-5-carboxymethylaminomethyl(34) synthesis GTPase MnmE [Acidobacteriota bacterium]|jgi:tRNA modification GTPase|nr:tRNA uridine-5-carboxymethylaminomethyl(34) synthesis GTPase MnmE [Acidobacteriota bacterium]